MNSNLFLFVLSGLIVVSFTEYAFADPLDDVTATVLEFDGTSASVELAWNHDDAIASYEVGCVSCLPNFSETTNLDNALLDGITPLANGNAILYIIAYDGTDEIVSAKQIMLELY